MAAGPLRPRELEDPPMRGTYALRGGSADAASPAINFFRDAKMSLARSSYISLIVSPRIRSLIRLHHADH